MKDRAAGICILVHQSLCPTGGIRYAEIIRGRLVHVRLEGRITLDLLAVYQHSWNTDTSVQEHLLSQRHALWQALHSAIASIPRRRFICVCGDLNTGLEPSPGRVGPQQSALNSASDQQHCQQLLEDHDLIALNTWSGKNGATCITKQAQTRIDFILIRRRYSSQRMKTCAPDRTHALGTHQNLNYHVPLVAELPCKVKMHSQAHDQSPKLDVQRMMNSPHAEPHLWCRYDSCLRAQVQELLRAGTIPAEQQAYELERVLHKIPLDFFPAKKKHHRPWWISMDVIGVATQRWQQWNAIKTLVSSWKPTLKMFLLLWNHLACQRRLTRTLRQQKHHCRRRFVEGVMKIAGRATDRRDIRGFHKAVRQLSVRSPVKRRPLHDPATHLACGADRELEMFTEHFATHFGSAESTSSASAPLENWTLDKPLLAENLMQSNPWKATPKSLAKMVTFKMHPEMLADALAHIVERLWPLNRTPAVPSVWKDGWITLLCKPGKSGNKVGDYRPIALQSQAGKCILKQVVVDLRIQTEGYLRTSPQFAYLHGRDTYDCIARFLKHQVQACTLARRSRRLLSTLHQGSLPYTCAGGISLAVDLTSAFDTVPRFRLEQCLRELGVEMDLISLIMKWHEDSSYYVEQNRVSSERGVRQGCVIAPVLFILYLHMWLQNVGICHPDISVEDMVTLFADDILFHILIHSKDEALRFLCFLGDVLVHLRSWGLIPNMQKTTLMYHLKGSDVAEFLSDVRGRERGCMGLYLPTSTGERLFVREATHITYLGIIISYHNPEDLTLDHRLGLAKKKYLELRRWWRSSSLTIRTRLQLWYTTVFAVLCYGLVITGTQQQGMQEICWLHLQMYSLYLWHTAR